MKIEILDFIREYLTNPVFDAVFVFCTTIVEHGRVWILTALIMLFTKKYRKAGILLLIAISLTFVSSEIIIKNLVCRPRPFYSDPNINLIIPAPSGYSFPSSHSSVSFAAATVIFYFNKKFGLAAFVLATLTAFSRLYLYVHYPTDVLAGICLGVIIAVAVIVVFRRMEAHNNKQKM